MRKVSLENAKLTQYIEPKGNRGKQRVTFLRILCKQEKGTDRHSKGKKHCIKLRKKAVRVYERQNLDGMLHKINHMLI